jgi:hypothetical protein
VEAVQAKLKPGESISVCAYALELYNEELRDLSGKVQHQQQPQGPMAAAAGAQDGEGGVRIAERPVGKDGRCIPEVCAMQPAAAAAAATAAVIPAIGKSRAAVKEQQPQ